MTENPILLDSITDADSNCAGKLVVSGSHGGIYPATVASNWDIRAVLFNDAGIGLENAGVAGVIKLAETGMAAATLDCRTCRIGSAYHCFTHGHVSVVNDIGLQYGVKIGMTSSIALKLMAKASQPKYKLTPTTEARADLILPGSGQVVELLDSASLVLPKDKNKILITGSHGGLVGGDPGRALKAQARIAVFNDAGVGFDGVGITRLPALDKLNIAAATVACQSARIGDARSALETGIISHLNQAAAKQGAQKGIELREWLENLRPEID